jgi:peptidoglycan/xylan/chitin deacetylase (PgdA/CDA1 family)
MMKQSLFAISGTLGVHRLFSFLNRDRPTVLAFHGVTSEPPGHLCNYDGLHLYRPIFERLMAFIAARYQPVALSRVVDWLEGRGTLPNRAVVVTFDDGYRNVFTQAAPVLKALGIPATLFVATDFVHGGKMLWNDRLLGALFLSREPRLAIEWSGGALDLSLDSDADKIAADRLVLAVCKSVPDDDRLALLARIIECLGVDEARLASAWADFAPVSLDEMTRLPDFGIEVGSHTCSHAIVRRMTSEQMTRELRESKRLLEASMGRPCEQFSYPNGSPSDFDARTRQQVIDAGYRCAVTTIKTAVTPGQDPFEIPRCVLTHNRITLPEFAAEVSGFPRFVRGVKSHIVGRSTPVQGGSWSSPGGTEAA